MRTTTLTTTMIIVLLKTLSKKTNHLSLEAISTMGLEWIHGRTIAVGTDPITILLQPMLGLSRQTTVNSRFLHHNHWSPFLDASYGNVPSNYFPTPYDQQQQQYGGGGGQYYHQPPQWNGTPDSPYTKCIPSSLFLANPQPNNYFPSQQMPPQYPSSNIRRHLVQI